ncbi:MAG: peptidoglycan DD-metalloendopeptidase family protein [bacterium]|nr:peptidoglycan DD-metalloendopeptidase family protein [bacterium]
MIFIKIAKYIHNKALACIFFRPRPISNGMRRNVKIAVLGLVFVLLAGFSVPAFGLTADDLKKQIAEKNTEIQRLEEEIKQFQGSISETQANAKTLTAAITQLNNQIKSLTSQINLTSKKISKKELEITELQSGIGEAEISMRERRQAMGMILVSLKQSEEDTVLETFLKYGTISDFFTELNNINLLNEKMRQNYNALITIKENLQTQKSGAEAANTDLKNLKGDLVDQKQIETQGKNEKSKLLTQTKSQEAAYQKLLKDLQAKKEAFERELFQFESQLKYELDKSKLPQAGRGVLAWPLDNIFITQYFGKTVDAARLYKSGTHNGIDLRARNGTPIKSAGLGKVIAIGNTDLQFGCYSYGKWILIDHQNGLSTLYAHLSLIKVVTGDQVDLGQIIGYSGYTGAVEPAGVLGAHLHLTVFASSAVTIQQYTTSINCKNVSIPVANPNAYLDPLLYL